MVDLIDQGITETLRQRLVNMYTQPTPEGPSKATRYGRPGLYSLSVLGDGPIRATFLWHGPSSDARITVSGNQVYYEGVFRGNVLGATRKVPFAFSNEQVVIVSGGSAYLITETGFDVIADSDLPAGVIDVAYLAGRFVYIIANDSQFRYSAIGDASDIDGLAFATVAENSADHPVSVRVLVDQLVFFTSRAIEWWNPTTDITAPFQRSLGRRNDKGLAGRDFVVPLDNTLFFVGSDQKMYRAGSVPARISDFTVENALRKVTRDDLNDEGSAFGIAFGGHEFYVVSLPGQGDWAFNIATKEWTEWETWDQDQFRVLCSDATGVMGDRYSGNLLGFDGKTYTDLDDPLARTFSYYFRLRTGSLVNFNVCINCTRGVGLPTGYGSIPVAEMRYSDTEGREWTNWMEAPLGIEGDRTDAAKAIWTQLGAIRAPGRAFQFRCSDPVEFSNFDIIVNEPRP